MKSILIIYNLFFKTICWFWSPDTISPEDLHFVSVINWLLHFNHIIHINRFCRLSLAYSPAQFIWLFSALSNYLSCFDLIYIRSVSVLFLVAVLLSEWAVVADIFSYLIAWWVMGVILLNSHFLFVWMNSYFLFV